MDSNNKDFDFSTLIEKKTNLFINELKSKRKILWESVSNNTSAYLSSYLDDIWPLKNEMTELRTFVPVDVYDRFVKEYDMTICLFHQCLIKAVNNNLLPSGEESKIQNMMEQLKSQRQENENEEAVILELGKEDPTTKKSLEDLNLTCGLNLSPDKIEKIIASGFSFTNGSVLDEVLHKNTKK